MFSEHLAWSTHDGVYLSDLLPVPYTAETLAHVAAHVEQAQDVTRAANPDREPVNLCRV